MKRLIAVLVASLFVQASLSLAAGGWPDDYDAALAQAKKENKPVLVNFTGSDWCGWCIKLKKETFDQLAFKSFAKDNVVLLEVDFPQNKKLPKATEEQNAKLQEKFNVEGFPTLVLLSPEGKELARNPGYLPGGPDALIAWVKDNSKK